MKGLSVQLRRQQLWHWYVFLTLRRFSSYFDIETFFLDSLLTTNQSDLKIFFNARVTFTGWANEPGRLLPVTPIETRCCGLFLLSIHCLWSQYCFGKFSTTAIVFCCFFEMWDFTVIFHQKNWHQVFHARLCSDLMPCVLYKHCLLSSRLRVLFCAVRSRWLLIIFGLSGSCWQATEILECFLFQKQKRESCSSK